VDAGDGQQPDPLGGDELPVPVQLVYDGVTEVWLRAQRWKTPELAMMRVVAQCAIHGVILVLRDNGEKRLRFQCHRNGR
jgi:hypothetical protein